MYITEALEVDGILHREILNRDYVKMIMMMTTTTPMVMVTIQRMRKQIGRKRRSNDDDGEIEWKFSLNFQIYIYRNQDLTIMMRYRRPHAIDQASPRSRTFWISQQKQIPSTVHPTSFVLWSIRTGLPVLPNRLPFWIPQQRNKQPFWIPQQRNRPPF